MGPSCLQVASSLPVLLDMLPPTCFKMARHADLPNLGPTWANLGPTWLQLGLIVEIKTKVLRGSGCIFQLFDDLRVNLSKIVSRWLQEAPKTPQDGPRRPKRRPRCFQDAPKTAQNDPRRPQDAPRPAQDAAKTRPRRPKMPQESEIEANMGPSWHVNPAQIRTYVDNLENRTNIEKLLKTQRKLTTVRRAHRASERSEQRERSVQEL